MNTKQVCPAREAVLGERASGATSACCFAYLSAYGRISRRFYSNGMGCVGAQVRAFENLAYVAVANMAGKDLVYSYFGGSNLVNFDGAVLAECTSAPDEVQYATLSLTAIRWMPRHQAYHCLFSRFQIYDLSVRALQPAVAADTMRGIRRAYEQRPSGLLPARCSCLQLWLVRSVHGTLLASSSTEA